MFFVCLPISVSMEFNPDIATAYRVDPRYLSVHGYSLGFEYVIKFRDINTHLVASKEGRLVTSHVPLPYYCTQGCEIELELLPSRLKAKLGLVGVCV